MKLNTRATTVPLLAAAAFVGAGGFIHLREWLDTYRNVPASVPGADVVRVGFPVNAALSAFLAGALVVMAFAASRRLVAGTAAIALLFQAGSLAALILSRTGSVLGWSEPVWSPAANQTRAVEIAALLALTVTLALSAVHSRRSGPASSPGEQDEGGADQEGADAHGRLYPAVGPGLGQA